MDARALRRMAAEVDEQHREAMTTVAEDLHRAHLDTSDPARVASRRSFLRRAGLGGAAITVGAVSIPLLGGISGAQSDDEAYDPDEADVELAKFAWSLELAAVQAYDLAVQTKLLTSAEAEVARLFARHHSDHATAIADLLATIEVKVNGTTSTTEAAGPNQTLAAEVTAQFDIATTAAEVLTAALGVEEGAAATYQLALETFEDQPLASASGRILPVESQHAVVLAQMLELAEESYLVSFQTTDDAFDPAVYAG